MFKILKELRLLEWGHGGGVPAQTVKYPGVRDAVDGNTAVIHVEREASDAAGAYPITPSTQMGEYWAEAASQGHLNISGRPLIFIEPESEHAAAGVTAGMAMSGLRAVNFSSAQGVAFMHESLYAAVGKRLPYVLNMGCRAITKASLNVHCGHDDYHCVDDTGFIQVMARNAQEAADLNLIARKTAELSLTPAIVGQDGFLTTHLIESLRLPERALVAEFLGRPDDLIDTPTPAQQMIHGPKRRRIPALWDVDMPMLSGTVQNQDAYMQATAAQRPYFFDHIEALADSCMAEYASLTGRRYGRIAGYKTTDADWLLVGMGSMIVQAESVADYLRETRGLKVGVLNLTMFRPFPGDLLGHFLKGKKGVAVLERTDQPLAEDLPLMREVRATVSKCLENGQVGDAEKPYAGYASYDNMTDMPQLFSGCYGLGSRDLQPEALIAAIENMLPGAAKRKFYYLSVDFLRDKPANPKDELHHEALAAAYPRIQEMSIRGSENPNLMPEGAVTVRMHSVGGWGAITTGKNLAVTLFELLGWEIKANPKYGSEKKGQPTTYYLSAAPTPIRVNCEYVHVDVVLSPDPAVFGHSNPLAGLGKDGVFIIQANHSLPATVWGAIPTWAQQQIVDNGIRVFFLDAFRIAREEAGSPELQLRMQGNAFQGAFFAASRVMKQAGLTEEKLFKAIEAQLESKFGGKGRAVVENNLRVVHRGFREIKEITYKPVGANNGRIAKDNKTAGLPIMLKNAPQADNKLGDVHRFWEQTGHFYATGRGSDNLVDPFIGVSVMPAATGVFRDMTGIRFEHPEWVAENCTACGNCYTACPDSAIPGLVSTVADLFENAVRKIETGGRPTRYLRKAVRSVEKHLRIGVNGDGWNVAALLSNIITQTVAQAPEAEQEKLAAEFELFKTALGDFQFAITKPYWSIPEKKARGTGGLFSITVNPYTCKACGLCVTVCEDNALKMVPQTEDSIVDLRKNWQTWLDLPTTPPQFKRIDSLDEKIGALETLLLDKKNYQSMSCGDGACLGCGEKTAIHLFTSTVSALMQPRVAAFVTKIDDLIQRLENHLRLRIADTLDVSDTRAMLAAVAPGEGTRQDMTLATLSDRMMRDKPSRPLDPSWVRSTASIVEKLKDLRWRYLEGPAHQGRAPMGMVNSTGCTSVWAATWPYNPYPFPWTNHLFQDSPSVAMGIFEGHMGHMADGFRAVRMAEKELDGGYDEARDGDFFARFDWHQFNDEEWHLSPPVVALGGDGAMYDIGFQNLSRALMSGMPIKVVVVDTQVYSNTGGQACTSGFTSQASDMAPWGESKHGKDEIRKEMSIIGMAHRSAFVLQSTIAHVNHLLEGYIDGLNSRRPALFNIYAVCPPEHGIGDDTSVRQSKLAVEGRAYPLFRFDPDQGTTFSECVSLEGNPVIDADWPSYALKYLDDLGTERSMELPLTFADFAATEARFAKNFKKVPVSAWHDDMLLLADFLALHKDEREGRFPYIWGLDEENHLLRMLVSVEMVKACEERLGFWRQLRDLASTGAGDPKAIEEKVRNELLQKISTSLGLGGAAKEEEPLTFEACWVDTPECTACNECMNIAPSIFAYDGQKKALVKDARGGKFADIVKAAEKCTAGCLHPGTPWNPAEAGLERLVARAAKFN